MKITGCYIVKNESETLPRSIMSIKGACDEIIVVDTGSEDNTVELAKELGATVLHFKWVNDFSKARNFAIDNATGDIIIFLDADEWFPTPLDGECREFIEKSVRDGNRLFAVPFCNFDGENYSAPFFMNRIFRNFVGLRYVNAIHEIINNPFGALRLPERFTVHHSGYSSESIETKSERNLDLLRANLEKEKRPAYRLPLYFYIARETSHMGNNMEAFEYLDKFFKLWYPDDKKTLFSIAIAAHHLRSTLAVSVAAKSDDECKAYAEAFLKDFPRHPSAKFCEANFYYQRTGDYAKAQKSIAEMIKLHKAYNPKDYPNDVTDANSVMTEAMGMKGVIDFAFNDTMGALESITFVMQKFNFHQQMFNILLQIIKSQPTDDIVLFINSFKAELSETDLGSILAQLTYFPELKDVYLYYAMRHIKLTKQHSDLTCIVSLFGEGPYDHVVKVAEGMREYDRASYDMLMCTAILCSNDYSFYERSPYNERIDRILSSFFENEAIEDLNYYELNVLARVIHLMMYFGRADITQKTLAMMENNQYERFLIMYNYCTSAGKYGEIEGYLTFDPDTLETSKASNCHFALGEAYLGMRLFNKALSEIELSLGLVPGNIASLRDLGIIVAMAPELSGRAADIKAAFGESRAPVMTDEAAAVIESIYSRDRQR